MEKVIHSNTCLVLAGRSVRRQLSFTLCFSFRSDPISFDSTSFNLSRNAFLAFFFSRSCGKEIFYCAEYVPLHLATKPNQIKKEEFPFFLCHLQKRDLLEKPFRTTQDTVAFVWRRQHAQGTGPQAIPRF